MGLEVTDFRLLPPLFDAKPRLSKRFVLGYSTLFLVYLRLRKHSFQKKYRVTL